MSAYGHDRRPFGRFPVGGAPSGPPPATPPPFPVEGDSVYRSRVVSPQYDDPECYRPTEADNIGRSVAQHMKCVQTPTRPPSYLQPTQKSQPVIGHSAALVNITDVAWAQLLAIPGGAGQNLTLRKLGMQLQVGVAFLDVQWRITADGHPVYGWDNIRYQVGTIEVPTEICILVGPGRTVAVEALTLTAGVVHFGRATLHGWYVPNSLGTSLESVNSWMGD